MPVPTQARLADRDRLLGRVFLLPAVGYIVALVAIPFFLAIGYSVSDVTTGDPSFNYVGLRQYRTIFKDPIFWQTFRQTLAFTFVSMVLIVVFGRLLATVLVAQFRGKWFVRFLILLPWTTPVALSTIAWLWMLDPLYSPIDWVLNQVGLLADNDHVRYLSSTGTARASVVAVHVWRLIPLAAVIMMAGMSAIPQDIKDAAKVDGAGGWRTFREVTLPLTMPVVAVAGLFSAIMTFTDMTVVRVLTNGSPVNDTDVLSLLAYKRGIFGGDLGQGAAISLFLFPLLLAFAVAILRAVKRMEVL